MRLLLPWAYANGSRRCKSAARGKMRDRVAGIAVFGVAAIGVVVGWWAFWFLCDDAFIAFRYAANLLHGWGLVWNPPPFAPVEGYTSFLWVVLLALVWALTGWQRSGHAGEYYEVVAALVATGAMVTPDIERWDKAQADPKMLTALKAAPTERPT